eukprot:5955302-Karenia_brevis.AAC.1
MGTVNHWTFDRKVSYLISLFTNSSTKAEEFRSFWKDQYGGRTSKKSGYFTRAETIELIANRLVVQHGSYGQERSRDRCECHNCPYMDHTGVNMCYRYKVLGGEDVGCRFRHDRQGKPLPEGWTLIDDPDWIYQEMKQVAEIDPNDGARTLVSLSIPEEDVVNP